MLASPAASLARRLGPLALALVVPLTAGCGERDPGPPVSGAGPAPATTEPTDWRTLEGAVVLPLEGSGSPDAGLVAAAIDRSRDAADAARARFSAPRPGEPDAWFVCWAAEVEGGGREYVWMAVDAWSRHRIEGRLASAPVRPLASGRAPGDRVAIAAGALADWLHRPADGPDEGGYLLSALEARRGRAADAPAAELVPADPSEAPPEPEPGSEPEPAP